jgi:hypothetical protein
MKFLKGVWFFVLILFFVFVLMSFIGKFPVGDVIWEPDVVGNCIDGEILALWNEVFVESGADVVILKEFVVPEGDCDEYIAYKNSSDGEFWVLYGDFYDSSWVSSGNLYSSGKKVSDFVRLSVFFMNVSSGFVDDFVGLGDVSDMIDEVSGVGDGDLGYWSVLIEDDVKNKFGELYEFVDVSGISFDSNVSVFYFEDSDDFDLNFSRVGLVSRKNDALFSGEYWKDNYDPDFFVDFSGEIDDFRFLINSSWNFAFDYTDYFSVSDNVSVEFDYVGVGNGNGEKVNYGIDGTDVSFMPAVNFGGGVVFRLVARSGAGDVFSNNFTVNITRYNEAPELIQAVPNIYVAAGGSGSLDLERYFDDEDDLIYGTRGVKGINVSFSGSVMTVRVGSNFSGYSRFSVYASDGLDTTYSDNIYVVEGVAGVDSPLDAPVGNQSVSSSDVNGGDESQDLYDSSFADWDFEWGFWIFLGVVAVIFVGGLVFFVYYFLLGRGRREVVSKDERGFISDVRPSKRSGPVVPSGVSPAEEYVRKLKGKDRFYS